MVTPLGASRPGYFSAVCSMARNFMATGALDSFLEFTGSIAEDGDALERADAARGQEPIQARGRRGNLVVHVGVDAGSTILKTYPARNEIDVASLAGWRIAMLEPCRIYGN